MIKNLGSIMLIQFNWEIDNKVNKSIIIKLFIIIKLTIVELSLEALV